METTTRRYRTPEEGDAAHANGESGPRLIEPLAPVPIWVLDALPRLPPSEIRVMLVLYAQLYRTLPWGPPMTVAEIAERIGMTMATTRRALKTRRAAGWIHENDGRWALGAP